MAVTDAGVTAVARGCPRLRVLRLYANSALTDAAVREIARLSHLEVRLQSQ